MPTQLKILGDLVKNKDLQETFAGVNQLVNKPELHAAIRSLDQTVVKITQAADGVQTVAGSLDRSVATLSADLKETLTGVRDAVKQIQVTVANVDGFVDPNSPTSYELTKALKELYRRGTVAQINGRLSRTESQVAPIR